MGLVGARAGTKREGGARGRRGAQVDGWRRGSRRRSGRHERRVERRAWEGDPEGRRVGEAWTDTAKRRRARRSGAGSRDRGRSWPEGEKTRAGAGELSSQPLAVCALFAAAAPRRVAHRVGAQRAVLHPAHPEASARVAMPTIGWSGGRTAVREGHPRRLSSCPFHPGAAPSTSRGPCRGRACPRRLYASGPASLGGRAAEDDEEEEEEAQPGSAGLSASFRASAASAPARLSPALLLPLEARVVTGGGP